MKNLMDAKTAYKETKERKVFLEELAEGFTDHVLKNNVRGAMQRGSLVTSLGKSEITPPGATEVYELVKQKLNDLGYKLVEVTTDDKKELLKISWGQSDEENFK